MLNFHGLLRPQKFLTTKIFRYMVSHLFFAAVTCGLTVNILTQPINGCLYKNHAVQIRGDVMEINESGQSTLSNN